MVGYPRDLSLEIVSVHILTMKRSIQKKTTEIVIFTHPCFVLVPYALVFIPVKCEKQFLRPSHRSFP